MSLLPIKTYSVTVQGFPEGALYSARSPAKARAAAWRSFNCAYDASFHEFLSISTLRRAPDPPGIGERIMVAGKPATRVIGYGQYVHYMRDDGDVILCSHPLDVTPFDLVDDIGESDE